MNDKSVVDIQKQTQTRDDTKYAIEIMKKHLGTSAYIFADHILRGHIKIDSEQRVTFWDLSDKEKAYLDSLEVESV